MPRALALVGLVLAGACTDGPTGPVAIADLPATLVAARCAYAAACELVIDDATCRASQQLDDAATATLIADVAAGVIAYDPAGAGACVDLVRATACTDTGPHPTGEGACDAYLVGTLPDGASCFLDEECASASCGRLGACDPTTSCCTGTCAASTPLPGAVGDACRNGAGCESSYCVGATAAVMGVCTAPITVEGTACADVFACANGLYCTGGGGIVGRCQRSGATGDACDTTRAFPCADLRDYCATTCQRRGRPGATCSPAAPCAHLADCYASTCVAEVGVGAACDDLVGPACIGGACLAGACTLGAPGASCR